MASKNRIDWDHYFMEIAKVVATRSTCDRKHIGAGIFQNKRMLLT